MQGGFGVTGSDFLAVSILQGYNPRFNGLRLREDYRPRQ